MIWPISENALGAHLESVDTPFRSNELGIRILYPSIWTVDETVPEVVSFVSSPHGPYDEVLETVDVSIFPTIGLNPREFANFLKTDFYPRPDILGNSFNVDQEDSVQINGRESSLLVYSFYDEELDSNLQAMDVIFSEDSTVYLLSFTADSDSYSSYLPIFTQMVESFEITGGGSAPRVGLGSSEGSDLTGGLGSSEGSDLTGGLGSSEGSNLTGGLGSSEGSNLTGGLGSSEGSDLTGGLGSSEGSNLTGGLGSSEGSNLTGGLGSSEGSDLTGGLGSSEGSDLTGGLGSSEGSDLTGGLGSSEGSNLTGGLGSR